MRACWIRDGDRGQIVGYDGETPIRTAKKGALRVGTHQKYGF
jgi:hypothetical protein